MTVDHPQFGTMCEICFKGLTVDQCATDATGQKWDVCKGECAVVVFAESATFTKPKAEA